MKFANEALFLIFSLILSGLFISAIPYFRKSKISNFNNIWLLALGLNILAFLCFASASTISPFLLTIANTSFFAGYFFLGLFSRTINRCPTQFLIRVSPFLFLVFACIFEYLRQSSTFQARVFFVVSMLIICLIWILIELYAARKNNHHIQLDFLMFTTFAELLLGIIRLWIILASPAIGNINLYEEPFVSSLVRWLAVSFTVLSYVSILGFWAETLRQENAKNVEDNIRIKGLLEERESLIANLLKANKTSATGALSASIAHELNQPLGASSLNIQFLRRKLDGGLLSPAIVKEVLDALELDNNRASTIVRSLRSMFADSKVQPEKCDLADSISNVLDVIKPELKSKNIQLQLKIEERLLVRIGSNEIEQVILNLLNNAIQSLEGSKPSLRSIVIEAHRDGAFVLLSICDNGAGVPAEFKQNLFELLNTTKQSGMGLGLWLCKHIVTRYEGSIWYEDASDGARFVIKLPRMDSLALEAEPI
jgi:signal transduction histidine kinase